MWLPTVTTETFSSFRRPVDPPTTEPGDGPTCDVAINADWVPLVLGCLSQLLFAATWDSTDPDVLATTRGRVQDLLGLFALCAGPGPRWIGPLPFVSNGGPLPLLRSGPDGGFISNGATGAGVPYNPLASLVGNGLPYPYVTNAASGALVMRT